MPASTADADAWCEHWANGATSPTVISANSCVTDDFLVVHTETEFTLVTPLIGQFIGDQTITGESRVVVNQ